MIRTNFLGDAVTRALGEIPQEEEEEEAGYGRRTTRVSKSRHQHFCRRLLSLSLSPLPPGNGQVNTLACVEGGEDRNLPSRRVLHRFRLQVGTRTRVDLSYK